MNKAIVLRRRHLHQMYPIPFAFGTMSVPQSHTPPQGIRTERHLQGR